MKFLRLRKAAEEINFEKDLMEAGKSKGKKDKVSEEQLEMGKEVEKEHTTNPEIAEKITRDHLEEIPDYYTHLKKMEDAVKKESAIQQPNKPKPTTTLPDNMEWSWDPNAADWVAVMKNNTNVTPPLYNPQNQNMVNTNAATYMSTVKSANNLIDVTIKFDNGDIIETNVNGNQTDEQIKEYYKVGKTFNLGSGEKDNLARVTDIIIDRSMQKKSSCLSEFLDGPRYSKEIKIEAGLIKEGLVKYAGFDFNRGTKYEITEKGLKVLRAASEQEHNEAQNEREKLAYLFGFNTNDISTLDTTGKVLKSNKKNFMVCEANDEFLGYISADNEIDAKVKFGIEHPEYADSLTLKLTEVDPNFLGEYHSKEIDSKYEETTEQHLDYPNPSETPHDDIILENHTGWVNTAEQKVTPEFAKLHSILGEYRKQDKIQDIIQDGKDLLVTCSPATSLELREQIEQLGYKCEETDESETGDVYTLPTFVLRIKMK